MTRYEWKVMVISGLPYGTVKSIAALELTFFAPFVGAHYALLMGPREAVSPVSIGHGITRTVL